MREVSQHKKQEHEIAGLCVLVEECASDGPAILLVYIEDESGRRTELLHFYAAMGLYQQHTGAGW